MLLLDENLSYKLVSRLMHEFSDVQAVVKVKYLGEGTSDERVWGYAKVNNLILITKDKDFVDYWKRFGPPPKISERWGSPKIGVKSHNPTFVGL